MGILAVKSGVTGVSSVQFFFSYLPLVIVHLSKSLCMLGYLLPPQRLKTPLKVVNNSDSSLTFSENHLPLYSLSVTSQSTVTVRAPSGVQMLLLQPCRNTIQKSHFAS